MENKARDALTELDKWGNSDVLKEFVEWKKRKQAHLPGADDSDDSSSVELINTSPPKKT